MKFCTIFLTALTVLFLPLGTLKGQDAVVKTADETRPEREWSKRWGIGVKAGLNGLGLELVKGLGESINLRLGYSTLTIPYSTSQDFEGYNLQVNARVTLGGANLLVDYYPLKNKRIFHITGGLAWNTTHIGLDVKSMSNFPYGDISIPAEEVGSITAWLYPGNHLSPRLAAGLGNTLSRNRRLSFSFELGVMYQGPPRIELSGEGVIGPLAGENNSDVLNKAIAQYSWFPLMDFQLTYRIL